MSLAQLTCLVSDSKYAEDLRELELAELLGSGPTRSPAQTRDSTMHAVMQVFCRFEGKWLSSGYFVRNLGLERWTAQKICGELAARGLLDRCGRTSATRYRFRRDLLQVARAGAL